MALAGVDYIVGIDQCIRERAPTSHATTAARGVTGAALTVSERRRKVVERLSTAMGAFAVAAEELRAAAALVNVETIAGLDLNDLAAFAAATDANRGGVKRMVERIERASGRS